jgi:hypothetical protein
LENKMSEYKSRVAMEDDAMRRGFDHDEEVQAGRVEFIVEAPSWGTRWSVDERSSAGRRHYSGWFASKEKAEQFVIERKAKLEIK